MTRDDIDELEDRIELFLHPRRHRHHRLELILVAFDLTNPNPVGSSGTFRATALDQNGAPVADASLLISVDDETVLSVTSTTADADGVSVDAVVTAVGAGAATVTASDGTLTSNRVIITVAAAPPAPVATTINLEQIA